VPQANRALAHFYFIKINFFFVSFQVLFVYYSHRLTSRAKRPLWRTLKPHELNVAQGGEGVNKQEQMKKKQKATAPLFMGGD